MRTAVFAFAFLFAVAGLQAQDAQAPNGGAFRSAGPREDLSVLAGDVLKQTNQARIDIKDHNAQAALNHVEQGQMYLRRLQALAHGSTTIPVYQEFVSVSILGPVQAAQRAQAKSKNSEASVTNNNAGVQQVSGDYTSVTMNTTVAKNNLAAAKKALEAGQPGVADQALQDVQEGVQIQMVQADMPLTRTRENLILARSFARRNDWTETRNALVSALGALKNYESENGPHKQAAAQLYEQIQAATNSLPQNHANLLSEINKWWNEIADWSRYKLASAAPAS
jgi:hypothetical protein